MRLARAISLALVLASAPLAAAAQGFGPPPAQGQPSPFPQQQASQPSPFPQQAPQPSPFPQAAQPSPFPQQSGFPSAGGAPSGFGPAPSSAPPGGMSQRDCGAKFLPLRAEAEKRAGLIKTATAKKAEREELCKLFKRYASAEHAMLKFMTGNQTACRIPAEVIGQVKTGSANTAKLVKQVCATAAAAAPPPPSLSEALGTARAPVPSRSRGGGSTFNTLTGSPLAR
jgi:hypothetical protein